MVLGGRGKPRGKARQTALYNRCVARARAWAHPHIRAKIFSSQRANVFASEELRSVEVFLAGSTWCIHSYACTCGSNILQDNFYSLLGRAAVPDSLPLWKSSDEARRVHPRHPRSFLLACGRDCCHGLSSAKLCAKHDALLKSQHVGWGRAFARR